jgi:hypothetical protein
MLPFLLLLISSGLIMPRRNRQPPQLQLEEDVLDEVPEIHPLVEWIGKEMYSVLNKRKYRVYIYMTMGKLPNEQSTIALLSTLCNVLYSASIWFGLLLLPMDYMLILTLLTFYVGPAMILLLLGALALTLVAFAVYIPSIPSWHCGSGSSSPLN